MMVRSTTSFRLTLSLTVSLNRFSFQCVQDDMNLHHDAQKSINKFFRLRESDLKGDTISGIKEEFCYPIVHGSDTYIPILIRMSTVNILKELKEALEGSRTTKSILRNPIILKGSRNFIITTLKMKMSNIS
jgi:hypothetical protein